MEHGRGSSQDAEEVLSGLHSPLIPSYLYLLPREKSLLQKIDGEIRMSD